MQIHCGFCGGSDLDPIRGCPCRQPNPRAQRDDSPERNVCPRCAESYGLHEKHYCPLDDTPEQGDSSTRIADSLERIADALERMNKREDALRRVRKAPSVDNALLDAALSAWPFEPSKRS